ncbi:hypothetical protein PQR67_09150 [Paraburkholderia fungorum]|uniref:hypothetical protein n=1 Tax=Paraburkholderia fungorum TaxID=134537 RepID=UPI0038BCEA38
MNFSKADQDCPLLKVDRSVPTGAPFEVIKEACGQLTSVFPYHQLLAGKNDVRKMQASVHAGEVTCVESIREGVDTRDSL